MRCVIRCADQLSLRLAAAALVLAAIAPIVPDADADPVHVSGAVTAIHVDRRDDRLSPGRISLGVVEIVVPGTIPVDALGLAGTVQELFARAPAPCRGQQERRRADADPCPFEARVLARRSADGTLVASKVTLSGK